MNGWHDGKYELEVMMFAEAVFSAMHPTSIKSKEWSLRDGAEWPSWFERIE